MTININLIRNLKYLGIKELCIFNKYLDKKIVVFFIVVAPRNDVHPWSSVRNTPSILSFKVLIILLL